MIIQKRTRATHSALRNFRAVLTTFAVIFSAGAIAASTTSTAASTPPPLLPATSTTLTLATYNIHSGIPFGHNALNYTVSPRDIHNIADVLTTAGADIIALQEVRND